jgi:hypothetical protein
MVSHISAFCPSKQETVPELENRMLFIFKFFYIRHFLNFFTVIIYFLFSVLLPLHSMSHTIQITHFLKYPVFPLCLWFAGKNDLEGHIPLF